MDVYRQRRSNSPALELKSGLNAYNSEIFRSHFYFQICKVLRHISTTEALQVSAKHAEVNLRVYAPQIVTAAQALAHYPCSKIIKENLEGESNNRFFFFLYENPKTYN